MFKTRDFTVRETKSGKLLVRVREHKTGYDIALGTPHHAIWLDEEDLKALARVLPSVLEWVEEHTNA